jgi:hypothetical protein
MSLHRASTISIFALVGIALSHCGSSSPSPGSSASGDGGNTCYPDNDGINNVPQTVDLVVNDTGFYAGSPDSGADIDAGMKTVITTQNSSLIIFTLTNTGTVPHGFTVECTSVLPAYPDLPAGCSSMACFPSISTDAGPECQQSAGLCISPIAPGTSTTVTFDTPAPDNLLYPFKSNAPGDANNPALNGSDGTAWSLM